jgi:hypothetical protein
MIRSLVIIRSDSEFDQLNRSSSLSCDMDLNSISTTGDSLIPGTSARRNPILNYKNICRTDGFFRTDPQAYGSTSILIRAGDSRLGPRDSRLDSGLGSSDSQTALILIPGRSELPCIPCLKTKINTNDNVQGHS